MSENVQIGVSPDRVIGKSRYAAWKKRREKAPEQQRTPAPTSAAPAPVQRTSEVQAEIDNILKGF